MVVSNIVIYKGDKMKSLMDVYKILEKLPFGRIIFSKLVCLKAPYFSSIRPRFEALRPGYCRIGIKKRRAVTNHLKTVHAIAMCNMAELAGGTMVEASIPRQMRWIPKGMTVEYLKMAKTDLTAVCELSPGLLETPGECPVTVLVRDLGGELVFKAKIAMYLSPRKS